MATTQADAHPSSDWILANPWFWMGLGLGGTLLAWGWVKALPDVAEEGRVLLIALGLLCAGGAVTIRFRTAGPAFLRKLPRELSGLILLLLAVVLCLLVLALSVLAVLNIAGVEGVPLKPGVAVIVWLLVAPMSLVTVRLLWRHLKSGEPISREEETGVLLVLAALACFFSCWGLYYGSGRELEWDTLRLFLGAAAFVALVSAPLVVVPQGVRRGVISLIILLHFGGICTAILAAPPTPWIISQLWTRVYRSYLEFLYLTNAYHFYAPEPGPATYLWFRNVYFDKSTQTFHGHWLKVPDFDDRGRPRYTLALQYQRYLALTENITHTGPGRSMYEVVGTGPDARLETANFLKKRLMHTPDYRPKLGDPAPAPGALAVPFHPFVASQQQFVEPALSVRHLLESYTRHVARIPYPDHPEYEISHTKVYRVRHEIPPEGLYIQGADPRDPVFYRPYYMGDFTPDGTQTNTGDPFLYWLLPIIRDNEGRVRDYARRHAGDPNWVRPLDSNEWTKWNGK
jgi:hypothetical protein